MALNQDLQSVLDGIRSNNPIVNQTDEQEGKVNSQPLSLDFTGMFGQAQQQSAGQITKFDVNPLAVYDKTHSGTYIPKFENFVGATGNEERLAKQQTTLDKHWNGFLKFNAKTINYAVDATIGTIYGIAQGIGTQDFSQVWDNDFSNSLDEVNKKLDNELPNYYTQEEKSKGVMKQMFTSANFWANDVGGGMAFVTGALLPEIALGVVTEGASVPASIGKFSFKLGAKAAFKAAGKKLAKETVEHSIKKSSKMLARETGANFFRNFSRSIANKSVGEVFDSAAFIARTSNFEAGMEARHNLHDAVETFYLDFEKLNGRKPTYEETQRFMDTAVSAANAVYGGNMAILSVSNAVMFGHKFNIGTNFMKRVNNVGNRLIGLGIKKTAGEAVERVGVSTGKKVLGNAYFILGKPATEGLYEEGLQGVLGKSMQNYLGATYDPKSESTLGVMEHISSAFAEQYGTKEGWKEMAIGMIIGSLGGVVQGNAPAGFGKDSYKARSRDLDSTVESMNLGRDNLLKRLNSANAQAQAAAMFDSGVDNYKSNSITNSMISTEYIKSQEAIKSRREIRKDYEAMVDNMTFSDNQIEELGGTEAVESYKAGLKSEFATTMENYRFATKAVQSIGLDQKLKDTPGEIANVSDALINMIVTGRTALDSARDIADNIDKIIGEGGSFSHMQFYNDLTAEQKEIVQEIKKKKRQVKNFEKQSAKYQAMAAGVVEGRNFSPETIDRRKKEAAEKVVLTNQKIQELNTEIANLQEAESSYLAVQNFDIENLQEDPTGSNMQTSLEHLDKLNNYVEALRKSGREADALTLGNLMTDFKEQADAYREMNNTIMRMADTNFFSTKEGKGIHRFIKGKKYQMSSELKEALKENDTVVDTLMNKQGLRGRGTVQERLEELITNNENLSEREKYRVDSLIRLQLNHGRMIENLEKVQEGIEEEVVTEASKTSNALQGDTVAMATSIMQKDQDLSNLSVVRDLISKVASEVEGMRRVKDPNTINILETKDFKRMEKLIKKRETKGLTDKETVELAQIEADIDAWTNLTGTVVEGLRLSDLVRQKLILENTPVREIQDVAETTAQDKLDMVDRTSRGSAANYEYVQTYQGVTAKVNMNGFVEISGITEESFLEKVGFDVPLSTNEQGNLIIEDDADGTIINRINNESNVSILSTSKGLRTSYNIVLETKEGMNGESVTGPMISDYNADFGTQMDPDALYDLDGGEELTLEVSIHDQHNQDILEPYQNSTVITQEIRDNISKGLVIRVKDSRVKDSKGNFVGVLKAKRDGAPDNETTARFESIRNDISINDEFLEDVLTGVDQVLDLDGVVVDRVIPGHPNFNFSKQADGSVTIDSKTLTKEDIAKVVDIGFVKGDKVSSRSGDVNFKQEFLSLAKNKDGVITPFIVLKKGNSNIAYPVTVNPIEKESLAEFENIFNSQATPIDKVAALNKMLASKGVDIKQPGKAFYYYGDTKTNLETRFFEERIAELENMQYFSDFNEWTNGEVSIEDILSSGVSVDIDVSNPFHSPKLKISLEC